MRSGMTVQYASRALTETEKRYNQIETDAQCGLTRFHTYTYKIKVRVYNGHLL